MFWFPLVAYLFRFGIAASAEYQNLIPIHACGTENRFDSPQWLKEPAVRSLVRPHLCGLEDIFDFAPWSVTRCTAAQLTNPYDLQRRQNRQYICFQTLPWAMAILKSVLIHMFSDERKAMLTMANLPIIHPWLFGSSLILDNSPGPHGESVFGENVEKTMGTWF